MRKRVGNLLLVSASFAIALLLAEGILRLFPGLMSEGANVRLHWQDQGKADPVAPHDYIGIVPQPAGLAYGEDASSATAEAIWAHRNLPPWPEQADVVVVGDSFAYSQTVPFENAWTVVFDRNTPALRAVTLGTIATGPEQYFRTFETYGAALSPKLVVVGLFLGNDIDNAETFDRWEREAPHINYGRFELSGDSGDAYRFLNHVGGKSYLAALARDFVNSVSEGRLFQGDTIELESGEKIQIVPQYLLRTMGKIERGDPGLHLTLASVSRIHELADSLDINCLVVLFPSKEEIYGQFVGTDYPLLSSSITPILEENGIDYFDLGPIFKERVLEGKALYHEVDGHPNVLGYRLIAESVFEHLQEHGGKYGIDMTATTDAWGD